MKKILKLTTLLILPLTPLLGETPWGLDNDLVNDWRESAPLIRRKNVATEVIRLYQNHLSVINGPRSHFRPSSSRYTSDAIKKHGFLKGVVYGADRLMRENNDPWIYSEIETDIGYFKWDPVR